MNECLCRGAKKPNPDLRLVECDEPTKSSTTIWTFGSSSGKCSGLCEGEEAIGFG